MSTYIVSGGIHTMTKNKYTNRSPPPPNSSSNTNSNKSSNSSHQQSGNNTTSGFFGNMFQGVAMGTGSSVGHKMVDSVFNHDGGNKKAEETPKEQSDTCKDKELHIIRFNKCMKDTDNNYSVCQEVLDLYFECSKEMNKIGGR